MSDLEYNLEYFNEQIAFWEDLAPDMASTAASCSAIPPINSWWPGLGDFFNDDQAEVINAIVDDFGTVVSEGSRAAAEIAVALRQSALTYAQTESDSEAAAQQIWSQLIDPAMLPSPTVAGDGSPGMPETV